MRNLAASNFCTRKRLATLGCVLWVVISAYSMALAYVSHAFAGLVWVALIPFVLVIRHAAPRAALCHGFLWGVVFTGLHRSVEAMPLSTECLATAAIGGISFAFLACGINWLSRRTGLNPLVFALACLVFEVVRAELAPQTGSLANSQTQGLSAHRFLTVTGLSALSFLIALVNTLLIFCWDWVQTKLRNRGAPGWCRRSLGYTCYPSVFCPAFFFLTPSERGPPRPVLRQTVELTHGG
jgi:apolipoprotein N-acyltransferase